MWSAKADTRQLLLEKYVSASLLEGDHETKALLGQVRKE